MSFLDFNPSEVADSPRSFDLIPPGEYQAQIIEADIKDTSTGGKRLALTFEILSGQYSTRRVFDNLNLWNSNAQAVEIARQQMKKICVAIDNLNIQENTDLLFKPMIIRLKTQPAKGNYEARNAVADYKPNSGVASRRPAAAAVGGAAGDGGYDGEQARPTAAASPAKKATPWGNRP